MKSLIFPLTEAVDAQAVHEALAEQLVITEQPLDEILVWLDTFDWRLDRAGFRLKTIETRGMTLLALEDGDGALRQQRIDGPGTSPEFADQLPAGPIRDRLTEIVAPRRLLPLARSRIRGTTIRVVDKHGKSRVVVRLERWLTRKPSVERGGRRRQFVRILPIRGYDEELRRVVKLLRKLGLEPSTSSEQELTLELADRKVGDYTSKLALEIAPSERTDEALRKIHGFLLGVIRANEAGTIADLDPEFLHDFRVAVRRSRALLTQFRGVYPKRVVDRFKPGLRWLQTVTGPTRDLHVYVLELPRYRRAVPEPLRPGLEPWSDLLYEELAREQAALARELASARYRRLLASWERFLATPPSAASTLANARRPCGELARERIERLYRRIRKLGRGVDAETPDAVLHAMRIECKKLRYVLEAFRSVFGARAERAIGSLRGLQDSLGDFNDCVVQTAALREFEAELVESGRANPLTVDALENLVGQISERKLQTRRQFEKRLGKFSARKRLLGAGA